MAGGTPDRTGEASYGVMKVVLRFLLLTWGVFMAFAFTIYLCAPNAMPWYVQLIMLAAALTSAYALNDE